MVTLLEIRADITIADVLESAFTVLRPGGTPTLEGRAYGVVIDPARGPVGLVTTAQTTSGHHAWPAVLVAADARLAELRDSDGITLLDVDVPAWIAVAMAARPAGEGMPVVEAVGVVPIAALDSYFGEFVPSSPHRLGPASSSASGIGLEGDFTTPRVTGDCQEPGCGHPYTLGFYDRRSPPACENTAIPLHAVRLPSR